VPADPANCLAGAVPANASEALSTLRDAKTIVFLSRSVVDQVR
jgi:hypothetical protein